MSESIVKGSRLVSSRELARQLQSSPGAGGVSINLLGVSLPPHFASYGTLIIGAPGSGKSLTKYMVMRSALTEAIGARSSQRAVCYDDKQELLAHLAGMGYTIENGAVILLNPYDQRCCGWLMGADITFRSQAVQLGQILIPVRGREGESEYWKETARQLVTAVALSLMELKPGRWTLRDLLITLVEDQHYLAAVVLASQANRSFRSLFESGDGETKHLNSVLNQLRASLLPFVSAAAYWHESRQQVSLRSFMNSSAIMVLGCLPESPADIQPLNRILITTLIGLVCGKESENSDIDRNDRTWFFLDELPEVGHIPLSRLMSYGRAKGASVVATFQSLPRLREIYGEEVQSVMGLFGTKLVLGLDCQVTAEWAEKQFGMQTIEYESSGTSHADSVDPRSSRGMTFSRNTSRETRFTVPYSEFFNLPPVSAAAGVNGFIATCSAFASVSCGWSVAMQMVGKASSSVRNFWEQSNRCPILEPWSEAELDELGFDTGESDPGDDYYSDGYGQYD